MKKILLMAAMLFTVVLSGCVGDVEEDFFCIAPQVLNEAGDECVDPIPEECLPGEELVGDGCEPIVCDEGFVLNTETNECEEEVVPLVCEEGYENINEECVKIIENIDFNEVYPEYNSYYQLFVRSFADSDNDGVGDFAGITANLDYLVDLGVTGLWLMPIHPSPTYHGYDVSDYYAVNPEYGTMEDFEELLIAADAVGIDIIIDLVINHTSSQHPWFQEWLAGNEEYSGYYRKITSGDSRLQELGAWGQNIWHSTSGGYYCGYFSGSMPDLNWSNPKVQTEMVAMAKFWLEKGVDGFRLDAAMHLEGVGEVLAPTVPIESTLTKLQIFEYLLEEEYPDVYIVGEIFDGFSSSVNFFQSMDSALNFEVGDEILRAVGSGFHTDYAETLYFYQNQIFRKDPDGIDAPFLKNHDQDRLATILNGDQEKLRQAAEMLLVLPGNPYIYYGEELGMFGYKSSGPQYWDETRRLPLPLGTEFETSWFPDELNDTVADAQAQMLDEDSLFHVYSDLLNVRKDSLALRYGTIEPYEGNSNVVPAYYRVFNYDEDHQEVVLIMHNISGFDLELSDMGEVIYYTGGIESYSGSLESKSTIIFRVDPSIIGEFYQE